MDSLAKIVAESDGIYEFNPVIEEYDSYAELDETDDYEEEHDDGRYDD